MVLAHLYLLLPVMLLCALFCARLGVERGQALETGTLPGLLLFAVLMFAAGFVKVLPPAWPLFVLSAPDTGFFVEGRLHGFSPFLHVGAPTFGLLFMACFAVTRADPPARGGFGWTLAGGALGALCVYGETGALGSIGALALYTWWSAGWRRALGFTLSATAFGGIIWTCKGWAIGTWIASDDFETVGWVERRSFAVLLDRQSVPLYVATFLAATLLAYRLRRWLPPTRFSPEAAPETPPAESPAMTPALAPLPNPGAHRTTGVLLFVALMGAPATLTCAMKQGGVISGWEFMTVPLGVAASLMFMTWLARAKRTAKLVAYTVVGIAACALLLLSGLDSLRLYPPALQSIRQINYPTQAQLYHSLFPLARSQRLNPDLATPSLSPHATPPPPAPILPR